MAEHVDMPMGDSTPRQRSTRTALRGGVVLLMGALAVAAPFFAGSMTFFLIGLLAIISGVLEIRESLGAPDDDSLQSAYLSAEVSLVAGVLLLSVPALVLRGLALLLAATFCIDGLGKLWAAVRARWAGTGWTWLVMAAILKLCLAMMLVTRWPIKGWSVVAFVVGIHMLTAGWSMLYRRRVVAVAWTVPADAHADVNLGLPPHRIFATLHESSVASDKNRRKIDAWWCGIFILLFFVIHVGRMRVYWNLVGMVAPLAAVVGDLAVALAVAFVAVLPARLAWRKLTRPLERRLAPGVGSAGRHGAPRC